MANNKPIPHLITYDIANKKRLTKVHRLLKNQAIPLQYSVFFAVLSHTQRLQIIEKLDKLIVDAEDDIRIYPLLEKPEWTVLGKSMWPEFFYGQTGLPEENYSIE